ncbi:glycosyltransferase [Kitasatospora sp. NPDC058965]|uniref:glycosyltransferase n=1 Tax=Kitasatospora sp. NPDC058965 TaxID=3346682 RepID=UPI003679B674
MSERPMCTVIVPTYNRADLLEHTLFSLARQSVPTSDFEVIVVDDGSTDSTPEVAARYASRLGLRYFRQADEGYRVAAARNVGISHARSEVCVFLDSGVLAHSRLLAAHLASHAVDPDAAVCGYVHGLSFDDHGADAIRAIGDPGRPDQTIAGMAADPAWADPREAFYAKHTDEFGGLPAPWVVFWTCNVSARTERLRAVGRFDEAYRSWGAEDIDLGYRLHRAGTRFVLNRAAASVHWPHPKDRAANTESVMANYRYFAAAYDDPAVRLVGRVRLFDLNDALMSRTARQLP